MTDVFKPRRKIYNPGGREKAIKTGILLAKPGDMTGLGETPCMHATPSRKKEPFLTLSNPRL